MTNPTGGEWKHEGKYITGEHNTIAVLCDPMRSLNITYRPLFGTCPRWDEAMANGQLIVDAVKAYRYLLEKYGQDWKDKI